MKELIAFLIFICLIILPTVLYVSVILDFERLEEQSAVERFNQNKKIEELEKEIRILKTDIQILNYGFEEEENEENEM